VESTSREKSAVWQLPDYCGPTGLYRTTRRPIPDHATSDSGLHRGSTPDYCRPLIFIRSCHAQSPPPFRPRLLCSYLAKSRPQPGCLPVTSSPPDSALIR